MRVHIKDLEDGDTRNMSVVQWVMNLPDRALFQSATVELIKELEIVLRDNSSTCKWFQYEELQISTENFSTGNLIGKGGSGQVYKGCLPDGDKVAIKLSKLSKETSKIFLLEADIITNLKHERIVPLLGICVECKNFLSVYGYFSKGSLEENLHGVGAKTELDWERRFKIAVGVAEALSYLHTGCSKPVIHRDVKSSNILLNDDFEPQLSDFGLATWAPTSSLPQTHNDIVGTFGYLAPEYIMYGKVSNKIDVYAYGVVLLELLTGREPISVENPKGQESLVMWATPVLERGDLQQFIDPKLEGKYDENEVRRTILVASLCIARTAQLRPQMSQVLGLLQGEEEIESWVNSEANDSHKQVVDCQDEEAHSSPSMRSHLGLALLDVEDDDASEISFDQNHLSSLDDYLRERWSRSSSFD
ncbi:PTI1-like tyrosine-protein kinase 1 isoform X2 [Asparagus officinalis]|nr:PTI1-like tyrosine-protein kinase 1 isoform X2 [Asparagus officinalis]